LPADSWSGAHWEYPEASYEKRLEIEKAHRLYVQGFLWTLANNQRVPVCLSASHVAHGSIRMEPVFMVLGESAATAVGMAIADNIMVQDVGYYRLRKQLLRQRQRL